MYWAHCPNSWSISSWLCPALRWESRALATRPSEVKAANKRIMMPFFTSLLVLSACSTTLQADKSSPSLAKALRLCMNCSQEALESFGTSGSDKNIDRWCPWQSVAAQCSLGRWKVSKLFARMKLDLGSMNLAWSIPSWMHTISRPPERLDPRAVQYATRSANCSLRCVYIRDCCICLAAMWWDNPAIIALCRTHSEHCEWLDCWRNFIKLKFADHAWSVSVAKSFARFSKNQIETNSSRHHQHIAKTFSWVDRKTNDSRTLGVNKCNWKCCCQGALQKVGNVTYWHPVIRWQYCMKYSFMVPGGKYRSSKSELDRSGLICTPLRARFFLFDLSSGSFVWEVMAST